VVELNDEGLYGYGQLAAILRARYCDARIQGVNKTDGLTFKVKEILAVLQDQTGRLQGEPGDLIV
jgi:2-oxoglutarate/2-oxoacid ferredoxin oxidoreductase subunit alpha